MRSDAYFRKWRAFAKCLAGPSRRRRFTLKENYNLVKSRGGTRPKRSLKSTTGVARAGPAGPDELSDYATRQHQQSSQQDDVSPLDQVLADWCKMSTNRQHEANKVS